LVYDHSKIQDETLSLKSQSSDALDELSLTKSKLENQKIQPGNVDMSYKPTVQHLIGTSNTHGIDKEKLTTMAHATKFTAYTLDETRKYLSKLSHPPEIMALRVLINDHKSKPPQECAKELSDIVSSTQQKWGSLKIIVSLATPRSDSIIHNTNGQIINALVKQNLSALNVVLADHSNMAVGGNPIPGMLQEDGYHLSYKGIAQLASNLKRAIHSLLGVPISNRRNDRSRSRSRRGRGRGFRGGRGRHASPN
jgi:hypothetical protein